MQIDITVRRLPTGFLVNNEGFNSQLTAAGHFKCWRAGEDLPTYCGGSYVEPATGSSKLYTCEACEVLKSQISSRYSNLIYTVV